MGGQTELFVLHLIQQEQGGESKVKPLKPDGGISYLRRAKAMPDQVSSIAQIL